MVYPSLIGKSKEFSQSISRFAAGGDTIEGAQKNRAVINTAPGQRKIF